MRFTIPKLITSTLAVSAGMRPAIRDRILLRQGNNCGLCEEPFSRMVPHEIHHINRNRTDNSDVNLIALCSNCHAAHHRFDVDVKPFFGDKTNETEKPYYVE